SSTANCRGSRVGCKPSSVEAVVSAAILIAHVTDAARWIVRSAADAKQVRLRRLTFNIEVAAATTARSTRFCGGARAATTAKSSPRGSRACNKSAANSDLLHRHNALHNWAIASLLLPPREMKKPGLLFRAKDEPAHQSLPTQNPTAARKSGRRSSRPRPIHAMRVVDFQSMLQTQRNRAKPPRHTVAEVSGVPARSGLAYERSQTAALDKTTFAGASDGFDKARASNGKV